MLLLQLHLMQPLRKGVELLQKRFVLTLRALQLGCALLQLGKALAILLVELGVLVLTLLELLLELLLLLPLAFEQLLCLQRIPLERFPSLCKLLQAIAELLELSAQVLQLVLRTGLLQLVLPRLLQGCLKRGLELL
jgi:hypothetical protein